jgi:hypothetical protein
MSREPAVDVEACQQAIFAFWRAFYEVAGLRFNELAAGCHVQDGEDLLTEGEQGLRYGAPGYPHLKLLFTQELGFHLSSNGMDLDEFLEFQAVVAKEFAMSGLRFHNMPV